MFNKADFVKNNLYKVMWFWCYYIPEDDLKELFSDIADEPICNFESIVQYIDKHVDNLSTEYLENLYDNAFKSYCNYRTLDCDPLIEEEYSLSSDFDEDFKRCLTDENIWEAISFGR